MPYFIGVCRFCAVTYAKRAIIGRLFSWDIPSEFFVFIAILADTGGELILGIASPLFYGL